MTTLSVVIPHYGDPAPTRALIETLLTQEPYELIVVDDHSPEPFPPAPAGVELVRRERNGGFGSAVNSGASRATGSHLVVLNSDLTVPDTFLEALQAGVRRQPDAVLSPTVVRVSGEAEWSGRAWPTVRHVSTEWLTALARWRQRPWWHHAVGHRAASVTVPTRVDWVVGAAMVIPLAAFRAVDGFDESFYMNCEEIDLQRRLAERGVESWLLPEPTVIHESGGSSDPERRREWLVAARWRYAEKYGSAGRLRAALSVITCGNFLVNCLRRVRHSDVHPVQTWRHERALIRLGPHDPRHQEQP